MGELRLYDSEIGQIAANYNVPDRQTYIAVNVPKNGDYYLFGGKSYTIIGMEYNSHQYGYQIAIGDIGTKERGLTSGTWTDWKSHVTTSELNGLSKINFNIGGSQTLKIVEPYGYFCQLLSLQGLQGNLYGVFILNGYNEGGAPRYHVTTLHAGDMYEITIGDEGTRLFNLINQSSQSTFCSIVSLLGSMPTISQ